MNPLIFDSEIANEILNDKSLREELISALNELIDNELSKSDNEIDFDIINTYTDALNELYAGEGLPTVLWKLQTADEFVKAITKNEKSEKFAKIFRITVAACAVITLFSTANYAVENATGQGIATHVAQAVQNIFTGEEVRDKTKHLEGTEEKNSSASSATKASGESTNEAPEEETTEKQEQSTTKPQNSQTTDAPSVSVTPQNPDLSPVLRPTTPPTQTTTTTTTVPFTRVDEDVTAAPIVIKLTGTYSAGFKKDYIVGESADFSGLSITATYDNGTTKNVSISQCSVSGFSTQTAGNKVVTVRYEGCSFSFLIRVKEAS